MKKNNNNNNYMKNDNNNAYEYRSMLNGYNNKIENNSIYTY